MSRYTFSTDSCSPLACTPIEEARYYCYRAHCHRLVRGFSCCRTRVGLHFDISNFRLWGLMSIVYGLESTFLKAPLGYTCGLKAILGGFSLSVIHIYKVAQRPHRPAHQRTIQDKLENGSASSNQDYIRQAMTYLPSCFEVVPGFAKRSQRQSPASSCSKGAKERKV